MNDFFLRSRGDAELHQTRIGLGARQTHKLGKLTPGTTSTWIGLGRTDLFPLPLPPPSPLPIRPSVCLLSAYSPKHSRIEPPDAAGSSHLQRSTYSDDANRSISTLPIGRSRPSGSSLRSRSDPGGAHARALRIPRILGT